MAAVESMPVYAVAGATGNSGGHCLRALSNAGNCALVAIVRDASKAQKQGLHELPNTSLAEASMDDPTALESALKGVERAFLVSGAGDPSQSTREINFLKAAQAVGVQVIVRVSTASPLISINSEGVYAKAHGLIEKYIEEADQFVIDLNPDWFMDNWGPMMAQEARATGCFSYPVKDLTKMKYALIATEDIGKAAAALLQAPLNKLVPLKGKRLELHGPRVHSYTDISQAISKAVGYEIVSKSVTPKEFVSNLVAAGVPKLMAESLALTFTTMAGDTPRHRHYIPRTDPAILELYKPNITLDHFVQGLKKVYDRSAMEYVISTGYYVYRTVEKVAEETSEMISPKSAKGTTDFSKGPPPSA